MRLSETEVISGLKHNNVLVRDTLLDYFAGSIKRPIALTDAVMSAVEKHGWRNAFSWPHKAQDCALDEDSLVWCLAQIEELRGSRDRTNLPIHLAKWVLNSPVNLLRQHRDQIVGMEVFQTDSLELAPPTVQLDERLQAWSLTPEECWEQVALHCETIKDVDNFRDARIPTAARLLEPIAATGSDDFRERVLALLTETVEDTSAIGWMGGLMIKLAGMMQIEEAFPILMRLFEFNWEWYNEEIGWALQAMGTPTIHQRAIEAFAGKPWYVRNYLTGPLESIHYDGAAENLLPVLQTESDDGLRVAVAVAIASQFDESAIESATAIYSEMPRDPERKTIIEKLFAFASVAELDLPDVERWGHTLERDRVRFEKSMAEDWKIRNTSPRDTLLPRAELNEPASQGATTQASSPQRVGRNEACPCGSGKKFKKCCLRNSPRTNSGNNLL